MENSDQKCSDTSQVVLAPDFGGLPMRRLKPMPGMVAIHARPVREIESGDSGLVILTEGRRQRWTGPCVGIGDGVRGIAFGDHVELRHMDMFWIWSPVPLLAEARDGQLPRGVVVASEDGCCWRLVEHMPQEDCIVICYPEDILYKIADWDWQSNPAACQPGPGVVWPMFNRLLVRHELHPERTESGIELAWICREFEPLAQVVAVGWDVQDLAPGDWVAVPQRTGTKLRRGGDPHDYCLLREQDIPVSFGAEKPAAVDLGEPLGVVYEDWKDGKASTEAYLASGERLGGCRSAILRA